MIASHAERCYPLTNVLIHRDPVGITAIAVGFMTCVIGANKHLEKNCEIYHVVVHGPSRAVASDDD